MSQSTRGVTLASLMGLSEAVNSHTAGLASSIGFHSIWVAETTSTEAFSSLAAIGAAEPSLDLGTGVLALQLRTPLLAAMGAATLQRHHPDRDILLGVGISSPVVVGNWHGASYSARPLAQTREYLTLLNELFTGEQVTFDGDFYHCKKVRLGVRNERRPKVILGALNRKMLHSAGELADGVLLNYLPATAVPWCVEQVREGERAAGRPVGSCEIYAYVHVSVTSLEVARDSARKDLFSYAVVDSYAKAFSRAGYADEVAAIRSAHSERNREGALAAVSDRMIMEIDVVGDSDHVSAAVAAYEAAGVDHAIIMALPWGQDRSAVIDATLRAAAPR